MKTKYKIVIIAVIFYLFIMLFLTADNVFFNEKGNATSDNINISYYYGPEKGTGYAIVRNGVVGDELTYSENSFLLEFVLDLSNITFKNDVNSSKFNDDLKNTDILYYVTFYDDHGNEITEYKNRIPFNESEFSYDKFEKIDVNESSKAGNKKIEMKGYIFDDYTNETDYDGLVEINDSALHIKNHYNCLIVDFSPDDAVKAKYAIVHMVISKGYHLNPFDANPYYYTITSKVENITLV